MIPSGRTSFFAYFEDIIKDHSSPLILFILFYFLITFRSLRSRLIIMYTFTIWTLGTGHTTHHDFTQPEHNIGFPRNCGARGFIEDRGSAQTQLPKLQFRYEIAEVNLSVNMIHSQNACDVSEIMRQWLRGITVVNKQAISDTVLLGIIGQGAKSSPSTAHSPCWRLCPPDS